MEYETMNVREVSTLLRVHPLVVLAIEKQMPLEELVRIDFNQSQRNTKITHILHLYDSTESLACRELCTTKIDELLTHALHTGAFDVSTLEDEFSREIELWPCSEEVRQQCYETLDEAITNELDTGTVSPTRADQLADEARSTTVQERCEVLSDQPYLQELQRGNCTPERITDIYKRVWTTLAKEEAIQQLLHL
jgi:hypothetical protein